MWYDIGAGVGLTHTHPKSNLCSSQSKCCVGEGGSLSKRHPHFHADLRFPGRKTSPIGAVAAMLGMPIRIIGELVRASPSSAGSPSVPV